MADKRWMYIRMTDMADSHLNNAITMVERRLASYKKVYDLPDSEFTVFMAEEQFNYILLRLELLRRQTKVFEETVNEND